VGGAFQLRSVPLLHGFAKFRQGARTVFYEQNRDLPQQLDIAAHPRQRQWTVDHRFRLTQS
jgi:hypothetical protein